MPVLFILFVVLPIAEIMVLINVSDGIGTLNTFLIVIVTAFFGAYFVRQQGFALFQQLQTKMQSGRAPSTEMAEGILLLIAGVLLITPGFITDGLGFLFTLPFSRAPIARFVMARMIARQGGTGFHFHQAHQQNGQHQGTRPRQSDGGDIIEGEIVEPQTQGKQNTNNERESSESGTQEQINHDGHEKNRLK